MLVSDEIDIAILDNTECEKENITGICDKQVFNKIETYNIPWDGRAENSNGDLLKAIILVVRSPLTGTMRTYTYSGSDIRNFHSEKGNTELRRKFKEFLKNTPISEGVLSICVDSDDNNYANRREIRVLDHATNSSGILLYELDNLYDPVNNPDGSRCANHGI